MPSPKVCDERHCSQPVDRGSAACYYHEKVRGRLIRLERFEFATTARIGRPQGRRVADLSRGVGNP